jgi:hypothetical protein
LFKMAQGVHWHNIQDTFCPFCPFLAYFPWKGKWGLWDHQFVCLSP